MKAAAYRGDVDHFIDSAIYEGWVAHSGYGALYIGNAFVMLDSNLNNHRGGYKIMHVNVPNRGADTIYFKNFSNWYVADSIHRADSTVHFDVPFDPLPLHNMGDSTWEYRGDRHYLFDTTSVGNYRAVFRMDTVTITVTIPGDWDVTTNTPLFAWGRSGGITNFTGWSDDNPNLQTGWSRVINGTGGDSTNEGIFHSTGRTFEVVTGQYDVWSLDYSQYLGHYPPDSDMAVNFTIYGRVDSLHRAAVIQSEPPTGNGVVLELDQQQSSLNAKFYLPNFEGNLRLDIYDMIGRDVASLPIAYCSAGWNQRSMITTSLPAGSYICRLSGGEQPASARFDLIK